MTFMEWLHMGKYGIYVWPSYGLTLAVVGLNVYWARCNVREARKLANRRLQSRRSEK